jgi:adenylate cyclase
MRLSSIDVIAAALEPMTADLGRRLSSPDGAVTLMLGDLAEPAPAVALDPERWQRIVADHNLLVERIVSAHDGAVLKFERDGFLAQFNSAHAGLHAAVELQRTFAGGIGAQERGLTARSGLHSGFVIASPEQPMGRNVVLTARIAAQAKGGEILVSSTLKQYTQTDPSFRFEERGEFHFKGMLGEHTVYAVQWR